MTVVHLKESKQEFIILKMDVSLGKSENLGYYAISAKYCALGNLLMYSSTLFLSPYSSSEGFLKRYKIALTVMFHVMDTHTEQKWSKFSGYGLSVHSK